MVQNLEITNRYLSHFNPYKPLKILGNNDLLHAQDGDLQVYYAPFDHIATNAKLVIVGITPGLSQATKAFESILGSLRKGTPLPEALRIAKLSASFSGSTMRNNLIAMLDGIGVSQLFGIHSTSALFTQASEFVHFTSAFRYPVFAAGNNYNGSTAMLRTPILRNMVETQLAEEAAALPEAVWLPLGPKAESAVMHLVKSGQLERKCVLAGLPHPSGANAERVAVFLGRKDPALASKRTNPIPLLRAFEALTNQINELRRP